MKDGQSITGQRADRALIGVMIGAGHFGPIQLDSWRRVRGARIEAVCDRDAVAARQAASRFGIPRSGISACELIEEARPDFVDIVTRPESHAELIEVAAKRGIHILCQKPLSPTLEDAASLVRRCADAGVRLMVTEIWRWQPWYRDIRRRIARGDIGRPFFARFISRRSDGRGEEPYRRQPYFRDMPRLIVYESVIHLIDVARFLWGTITAVQSFHRRLNPAVAGEDFCLVTLHTAADVTVSIDAHRHGVASQARVPEVLVVEGEEGSLELAADGSILWRRQDGVVRREELAWPETGYLGDSCCACLQHFADGLREGTPFETSGEDNLQTLAAVFAAYESASSGKVVAI